MKKMANSENVIKALFDNEEFLTKFQSLVEEQVSKSKLTNDVIENGGNGNENAKNDKKQSLGNESVAKEAYKRRKVANQSFSKQIDSVEDIKTLFQDEGVKKKIAPLINECILLKDNSDNSSGEKVVKTTEKNTKIININEDRKSSVEEIIFPNHSAAVMKLSEPISNVKVVRKPRKQNISQNNNLDKEINSYVTDNVKVVNNKYSLGAGVVEKETKNDSQKKNKRIILVPIRSIKKKTISPDKTNPAVNSMPLKQSIDLNTQNNVENCDMLESDDYYYLSMANSSHVSVSDVPEIPQIKNVTSNILDVPNINNSTVTIKPIKSTSETQQTVIKPIISCNDGNSNEKVKLQGKIVKRSFVYPTSNVTNQISEMNSKSAGSVSTQNTSNYQTIIVLTDNGEESVKILQPSAQNIAMIKRSSSGSKPIIKSNERVKLKLQGKVIRKFTKNINNSVVNDYSNNIITNTDPTDSLKMPKIESVMSFAESLPKITSVTSCATNLLPKITSVTSCAKSLTSIENVVTHAPSLKFDEDTISLAERISQGVINSNEKVLKIKRPATKSTGKKKFQKNVQQVKQTKNILREFEKRLCDSFSSNTSVDVTIEEVIAQGVNETHDANSVALDEEKFQEDAPLHMNGLSITKSPKKELKVLKPVKKIEYADSDIQGDIGNVSFATVESVDRSGLPSIKNVVSLAKNHILDDCLKEANEKLSTSIGTYATNITEKKFQVPKPADVDEDGFKLPSELFENHDIDMQNESDDFNFAVDSLIEDMSAKTSSKRSSNKNKLSPPFPTRRFGRSNGRNKGLKVLKPVIKRQKKRRRKAKFGRRKIRAVEDSIQNDVDDVDKMGIDFADLNLIDTKSSFADSENNDASFDQSEPIKTDTIQNKLCPEKLIEKHHKTGRNGFVKEDTELPDSYIAEPSDNSNTGADNTSNCSPRAVEEECEELLEEVPLQQRRCNNFYVKVPTGEELGNNIDLAEYEKFFSIQDENHPKRRFPEVEIESVDNDEDFLGTLGKRRTKCSKCDKTFVHSANREIHEATCENNNPQSSECSKCGRWFARTAYRKVHEKKCQIVYGTIEVPVTPLNDLLRCAMCPFTTGHKTAYINHLKSHMYSHKKPTSVSSRTAALRKKFGYRRKKRKFRFGAIKNRCDVCNDDASGVEHMVSRCRRCGAFNLQWCDECHQGGYSTACRLRHHDAECTATPHTRCNDVPRVHVERIGPPLPLHCTSCDVTRILYIREKRCKQCSSQLLFKCEMCDELRDTFAELCGHVARAHIIGCLVQCDNCGKNCEDLTLHRRVCDSQKTENESAGNMQAIHFSEDDDTNDGEMQRLSLDNIILELDEDSDEDQEQRIEEV